MTGFGGYDGEEKHGQRGAAGGLQGSSGFFSPGAVVGPGLAIAKFPGPSTNLLKSTPSDGHNQAPHEGSKEGGHSKPTQEKR